jgi:hypothetical protein
MQIKLRRKAAEVQRRNRAGFQQLTPIILATREAKIGRTEVQG